MFVMYVYVCNQGVKNKCRQCCLSDRVGLGRIDQGSEERSRPLFSAQLFHSSIMASKFRFLS